MHGYFSFGHPSPSVSLQDIEQLLNHIGAESLGPRHVLANLKQLTTIVQSQQYI